MHYLLEVTWNIPKLRGRMELDGDESATKTSGGSVASTRRGRRKELEDRGSFSETRRWCQSKELENEHLTRVREEEARFWLELKKTQNPVAREKEKMK